MIVHTTEAQAWWIAMPDEIRPTRGIDVKVIAEGMREVFGFPLPPTDEKGGAVFLNGRLEDTLIPKMTVFSDGINIQVPTNTAELEKVMKRALEFFFSIGVRQPLTPPISFFQSIIVADFDAALDNLLPSSLLSKISAALPIEGNSSVLSIASNFDAAQIRDARWAGLNPSTFKIERRAGVPYSLNRYFSLANMTTDDHLEILNDFERMALGKSCR